MDVPQYSIRPDVGRIILPKVVLLVVLSVLFYVALWLNLKLGLGMELPLIAHILVGCVLVVAAVLEIIRFRVLYAQSRILFYTDRLVVERKRGVDTLRFSDVSVPELNQNFFDLIMKTGSIRIGNFVLDPVRRPRKIYDYLMKLIKYYDKTSKKVM